MRLICRVVIVVSTLFGLATAPASARPLTDPTRPPAGEVQQRAATPQRNFTLGSVMLGKQRRFAIIDGQVRQEGQRFDGVRLLRVHPDNVELLDQGRVRVIRLEALPQIRQSN
ncbi:MULTISPECIES: hypothetical protein [Marinobacter]|uniref:MSHA biogenesis protein MshK n=1 Tax=Marinobacter profundi TaxID=2666256 RepID=A0A2G1UHT8_9GAMM|nr:MULTISPECIES: hypothetical protein [Marinobacter]MBD3657766.1 hypothetical protein [Marinobacter sp.]PHQ14022.1 hypothetical protein CLH61_15870 [Marinobacter profundi]